MEGWNTPEQSLWRVRIGSRTTEWCGGREISRTCSMDRIEGLTPDWLGFSFGWQFRVDNFKIIEDPFGVELASI
jgi:hypothetical protein